MENNTFNRIGSIVRNDKQGRGIKDFNPFLKSVNVKKWKKPKNKKGYFDRVETHIYATLDVDMDNQTVKFDILDQHPDKMNLINFALSDSNNSVSYLVGNIHLKLGEKTINELKDKQLSYKGYKTNYVNKEQKIPLDNVTRTFEPVLINNNKRTFIDEYREVLDANLNKFIPILEKKIQLENENFKKIKDEENLKNGKNNEPKKINNVFIKVSVKYKKEDGENKYKDMINYQRCIKEMDDMFLHMSNIPNTDKYTFFWSFFDMFSFVRSINKEGNIKNSESIPQFNRETFLNYLYSNAVYKKQMHKIVDLGYVINVLPNSEYMDYDSLIGFLKISNVFDFDGLVNKSNAIVNSRVHTDRNEDGEFIKRLKIKFDVYFQYESNGNRNFFTISGIRYNRFMVIRDKMKDAFEKIYEDIGIHNNFYSYRLLEFFKDHNGNIKHNKKHIEKFLKSIFEDNIIVYPTVGRKLINKTEYAIGNYSDSLKIKKMWQSNFNFYKFLKLMENKHFDFEQDESYVLGRKVAEFEKEWKGDRKNLRNYIRNFAMDISRKAYTWKGIEKYMKELIEKMERNNCWIDYKTGEQVLNGIKNIAKSGEYNREHFAMGYFQERLKYNKDLIDKKKETTEEIEE